MIVSHYNGGTEVSLSETLISEYDYKSQLVNGYTQTPWSFSLKIP